MITELQYPIFVRVSKSYSGTFKNLNNSLEKTDANEEISIMFVATPIDDGIEYKNEKGEWVKREYQYSKNEFYIFVSEKAYNEIKYEYEYGRRRHRMFAPCYNITKDKKTSKIKNEWTGVHDMSDDVRQELLSVVMSRKDLK